MKELEKMSNVDKAELLHSLFPDEIPFVLDFIAEYSTQMIREFDIWSEHYDGHFITAEEWLEYTKTAREVIERYRGLMVIRKRVFADQLFDGMLSTYTNHCIAIYVTESKHKYPSFLHAAHMLYDINRLATEIGY